MGMERRKEDHSETVDVRFSEIGMKGIESEQDVAQGRAVLTAPATDPATRPQISDPLGEPLDIRAVARLIGCSVWTVRQTLIRRGLPCFRLGVNGKLLFYRHQVTRWIVRHQRAEGGLP